MLKKITALCLAVVTAGSLTSCTAEIHTRPGMEATGATLTYPLDYSWKVLPLLEGETVQLLQSFYPAGEYIVCCQKNDAGYRCGVIDTTEDALTFLPDHAGSIIGAAPGEDGALQVLWEDAEMDEKYCCIKADYSLVTYSENLEMTGEKAVIFPDIPLEDSPLTGWMQTEEGGQLILDQGQQLHYYDASGAYKGIITGNAGGLRSLFIASDGTPCVVGASGALNMAQVELDSLTYKLCSPEGAPMYASGFYTGNEEYSYFVDDGTKLYGVRKDTEKLETVIDYQNSDLNKLMNSQFYPLPDGDILFIEFQNDYAACMMNNSYKLYRLRKRSPEEIDSMKCISVAAYQLDDYLNEMIVRWNRQSSDVRFVVKVYHDPVWQGDEAEAEKEAAFENFKHDLLDGVIPDVFVMSNLNYEMLSNKGMLEDLQPYMERDPEFRESDYYMNFFDALKYRGVLDRIGFSYNINTFIAKSEHVGDSSPKTIGDFAALADTLSEDMSLFNSAYSQELLLQIFTDYFAATCVDWEKGVCSFESDDVAQMLELCRQGTESYISSGVWSEEFKDDKAMLYAGAICSFEGYHAIHWGMFGDESVAMLGVPQCSPKGNGGLFQPKSILSMCSASLYKDEIWEFIKFCLRPENQSAQNFSIHIDQGFPVNREAFDQLLEKKTQTEYDGSYSIEDIQLTTPPTKEEGEELKAFIEGIERAYFWNEFILPIVAEEADMLFAGDCTAEQAAENIRSRVNLYLAEQS